MDKRDIVKTPCKDCPDRSTTCHAECERYAEYARLQEEKRKHRKSLNHADEYLADYRKKRRHKETLDKKRKGASLS